MRPTSRLATILLLAAATLAPATARAGGFAATRFGGEHGHPATDDPTAVYYNPAGLAYGHGTRILVEGLFVYRTADYTRDPGDIDNAAAAADEVAAILDEELARVRAGQAIDQAALDRAVRRREAALWWRLDGLGRRAAMLCGSMLATGGPDGAADELARYQRLDLAALVAAASRWMSVDGEVEVRTVATRLTRA